MATRKVPSFCRVCCGGCGTLLTLDENDKIVDIRGDRANALSKGYVCFKGLQAAEAHHGPARILNPMKQMSDGTYNTIPSEQAFDEIAEKLRTIIAQYGPAAVATYTGGNAFLTITATMIMPAFREAIGTAGHFSCSTIDQPGKWVSAERLGGWAAGKNPVSESDVVMLVGTNPLVSHGALLAFMVAPINAMKKEKARGVKVIVIDPRLTETARFADVHLQPYPGEDPTLISGILRIILTEGWEDKEFCARYVKSNGIERMRAAVDAFTPEYVKKRTGVPTDKLWAAAALFARDSKKGSSYSATGPSMSPRSNLAEHLIDCLNVVCGRFRRAGDRVVDVNICEPERTVYAEVVAPTRPWERQPPSRIRGARSLQGEMFTATLADEILTRGEGQIRALIVDGGNPATAMPDQHKAVKALKSLDVLVSVEPYMTTTARLSHYILPPKLQYERADMPMAINGVSFFPVAWGQYTPEILKPPAGSDVVDDWYVYWSLAKRLGLTLKFNGVSIDMDKAPTSEELLALRNRGAAVSFEEIKQYPSGNVWDFERIVQPARPDATGRFDVMPDELLDELREVAAENFRQGEHVSNGQTFSHRLAVRRSRDLFNSVGLDMKAVRTRNPYNPAWLNPTDMAQHCLLSGDKVEIISDHGKIEAIVKEDKTVLPGVVMMSHGWGGLPEEDLDYEVAGSCTNLLIDTETNIEPISSMVRMSAIPVNIRRMPNYGQSHDTQTPNPLS
jgi:anaerobic selenocysteine-containing dehydrogenase